MHIALFSETGFAVVDALVVVVADAHTTTGKAEPISEYASTLVLRVEGQQSV